MSETSPSVEAQNQPRQLSRWAVASMVFVVVATLAMVKSKQLPIPHGWGQDLTKGTLYLGSWASLFLAILCCLVSIGKKGLRQWEVVVSTLFCLLAPAAHYVIYEWWPTPEMLVTAAARNDFARVKRCLDFGLDIDVISPDTWGDDADLKSALIAAVRKGHKEMVDYLLERGADVNRTGGDGIHWSPLDYALLLNNRELSKLLISRGARPTAVVFREVKKVEVGNLPTELGVTEEMQLPPPRPKR